MRITYSAHARRRMNERNIVRGDVESVLSGRGAAYPSGRKRTETGRTPGGRVLRVVYTESEAQNFHIVSVVIP